MKKEKRKGKLQVKFLFGLVILALILIVALGVIISDRYRKSMETYYSKMAFDQAKIVSMYIDGDRIAAYAGTLTEDDYYDTVSQYLLGVKKTVGLKYLYVVIPFEGEMFYIWDAGDGGEDGICTLGQKEEYYGGGKEIMREAFLNPDAEDTILITNNDTYGYLASAYVAVFDSKGRAVALSGVDISMDMIEKEINEFIFIMVIVITMILAIFMISYFFLIKKAMLMPLDKLHNAASTIISEQMDNIENFVLDIHTGDEIEGLADAFVFMASEMDQYIKNLTQITAEKERISAELDVATKIQADMLPSIFPPFPEKDEIEIYATMTPAKEVGGDFYDFFLIDEDHLALVIADVSGKGVPAALFMTVSKILLENSVQAGASPKETLEKVNNQLCEHNQTEMFVTVWLGILQISTGKMTCANAGHEYPAVRKAEGEFELFRDQHGFVLAGMEDVQYVEYEIVLDYEDRLYLYTDGVPEAIDANNNMYGEKRMLEALNRKKDASSEDLLHFMKQDIDRYVNGMPQFDDITMLTIKRKRGHGR